MFNQALFAYLHYLSIIVLIITIVVELILFKPKMRRDEAIIVQRADGIYGLASIMVLITGFLRVIYFAKGWDYYFSNDIFLIKLGLFIVVGLLSIYPTRVFLRWRKELKENNEFLEVDPAVANRIILILRLEAFLVFLIPLLAAFMARGIGFVST